MSEQQNLLRTILLDALEIADPQKRARYLSQACGADSALRREVEELIQAHQAMGQFLPDQPAATPARATLLGIPQALDAGGTSTVPITEEPCDWIGHYKLLQKIGEGGCGVVYMAEQEVPVRRRVALKVIKLGMDTESVVGRFEVERQALALMDHPNIAKVHDAGATDTGRPFFVMELVQGIKMTDYCDENSVPTRERLELFIQVCHAIQHAHQKGVIHRDIKPSNILVALRDGVHVPKVIDFGIAKATTDQRLTDKTLFTAIEQFVGTPAYMSPEQAEMSGQDVDTRTDIYSLGVLLYELLTGKTPFDAKELLQSGLDEMRRTIREREPAWPSTRLRMMPEGELTATANHHQSEPAKFTSHIRGDMDWIVMKALEKDRARRYETVNGLARDIQRHLNDEAVVARPPSLAYTIRKFVRRNKVVVTAVAIVAIVLVLGVCVTTWEAIRATRAESDAKEKLGVSYLAQAQAGRWSRRAGRRFDGLDALKKAAEIRPSLELRNEAIACMALLDLRVEKEWEAWPEGGFFGGFDGSRERYVFGDAQGTVHVRRARDGIELAQFPGYELPFASLELSPDDRFLFVASGPRFVDRVEVLDMDRKESALRLSERYFRTLDFSTDSSLVAICYDLPDSNWPVRIFDLIQKKEVASFKHGSLPWAVRFSPKRSDRLLSGDGSSIVRVWDWKTGQVVQSFSHPNWVQNGIDWHPDGEIVATACGDGKVRLWDADRGRELVVLAGHDWAADSITFSHDGAFLASHGWDGVLKVWDSDAKHELVSKPANWIGGFSSSGNKLAIGTGPRRIAVLDVVSGHGYRLLRSDLAENERSVDCNFSVDGRILVSTSEGGMRLWDVAAGKQIAKVPKARCFPSVVFHPDGTNFFLGTLDGVDNWSLEMDFSPNNHFKLGLRRKFDTIPQTSVISLTGDGRILAVATEDGVNLLDTTSGLKIARLKPVYGFVFAALDTDGQLAATWTRSSTNVQIWDVASSNLVHEIPAHPSIYVAFSPNKQSVVVGDGVEFHAWDLRTWRSLYVLPREPARYYGYMAFSPDSRMLAVAISRSTVRLVEASTGRELATLEGPDRLDIDWIVLSPDGTRLAVVGGSGPIQLWDLRLIREQLASMKLDWELPPFPPSAKTGDLQPLTVTVLGAEGGSK